MSAPWKSYTKFPLGFMDPYCAERMQTIGKSAEWNNSGSVDDKYALRKRDVLYPYPFARMFSPLAGISAVKALFVWENATIRICVFTLQANTQKK